MMDAGVFYGRKKSKSNPKMRQFILANRGGVEIINLQKSSDLMEKAAGFIKEKVRDNGLVLIVGSTPGSETGVMELAKKYSIPYVTVRWVGGAITNYNIISKRVDYMKKLRSDFATGALDKYTKKERLDLEREMNRLQELMGGLENLTRQPDLVIIIDPIFHHTALAEARTKKIPVIAFANVDADPDHIDYIVPGNDKAKTSVSWFLGNVDKAIEEGIKMRAAVAKPEEAAAAPAAPKTK